MVQPRQASTWLVLSILAALFVTITSSPRFWAAHEPRAAARAPATALNDAPVAAPVETAEPTPIPDAAKEVGDAHAAEEAPVEAAGPAVVDAVDELLTPPADQDQTPTPVAPASAIASKAAEPTAGDVLEEEAKSIAPLPDSMRRLPEIVASIPARERVVPHEEVGPDDVVYPDTSRPHSLGKIDAPEREPADRGVEDSWWEPETLLESLKELTNGPASHWATEVTRQIMALGAAVSARPDEAAAILQRLTDLDQQVPGLVKAMSDRAIARKLRKTGYALSRRLDVWQAVGKMGEASSADHAPPRGDRQRLALCLAEIEAATADSPAGQGWRNYLLVDGLKESAKDDSVAEARATQRLAQETLVRLSQTPLTRQQQQFIASGPVAALRQELRRWATEPIGATALMRDIERFERTAMPSDARRLALDLQNLSASPLEGRRRLSAIADSHYRNGNLRIAVTEDLLNRLVPERNLEYATVDDMVVGRPTRGESLMATEVAVRMLPDPHRVRVALEVAGEIQALTTTDAGPVRFHNDSQSSYIARKPLEIDMKGISVWPVEVDVQNETQLRDLDAPLQGVPLIGRVVESVAKSQLAQNKPAATREVKEKIATQASERINKETRERLTEVVAKMNQRVFDPLNSLALDPQMIAAETTETRFTMRLRLGGEDQLGSHTPRPQAPSDSLASVQLHETVLNNCIQRLQVDGRTFNLPDLSRHVAARLNRPAAWETNPEHADVKIAFADKDSIVVRCQDGRVVLTLSIAQLSKGSRKWKNFQIRAFYRPEVNGRSAQLVRDGIIHLMGERLNAGAQIALRGIFSRALSKNNSWELVPEQIIKEKKLKDAGITQFVVDDGWIGIALGPKPTTSTARRPNWGLW